MFDTAPEAADIKETQEMKLNSLKEAVTIDFVIKTFEITDVDG